MWPNPQFCPDLVTFTEETLMKKFIFCAVIWPVARKKSLFVSEGCNLRCFLWKKNWAIETFERLFLIRNNTVNNILMFL